MHLCLCVDDILRLVFRCIEDRSTLCALARICRTFKEPAVDLIWETLTAVEPILQASPFCEWATDGSTWYYHVHSVTMTGTSSGDSQAVFAD
ncbi:hypothetical protein F5J12DRAFT_829713 [Pisolithus orientalis]|uniref:uncharacterized protein n=1 Tax=Pisolithus orientalis TaxID=936130 RepID=UPI0022245179|nr:uncharacterized protein F5J12DRAFT_829713 [Pisolithus orientalis]KAI6007662.1 hypothetical protein F5J12DRAFT_829713 [Pisolithus orientalis]